MIRLKQEVLPKKHIIFDWNGSLFNDINLGLWALNTLLEAKNLAPLTLEEYRDRFCFPVQQFYQKIGLIQNTLEFEALTEDFVRLYFGNIHRASLFQGTRELLEDLTAEGVSFSLLSAAPTQHLYEITEHYEIKDFFGHIQGLDDYQAHGKVAVGHQLMEKISLDIEDLMLIGDTDHDYHVAGQLKIEALLMDKGHQSLERLKQVHDRVFERGL